MTSFAIVIAVLALTGSPSIWAGSIPTMEKKVIIDERTAASLTNRTEQLLHQVRIPEIQFAQGLITDIVKFLNDAIKENGKTEEARQITIALDPDTEKELMKYADDVKAKGRTPRFTFAGLDMSVLEAVQVLQRVAQLDRKIEGQKLILSTKKQEKQVQQSSAGDSSTRATRVSEPPEK